MRVTIFMLLGCLVGGLTASRAQDPQDQLVQAVETASGLLEKHPDNARLWNQRGGALFMLGRIDESIRDFDKAVRLDPASEPHHWQRGISYYYAGRYADGRRQFEVHRGVNANDVENAAWHFLCAAREKGVKWASAHLISIETSRDTRVPMHEIYQLFDGRGTVEQVLKAAGADDPKDPASRQRHNYAHLYLGLWYEAAGEAEKARFHIRRAAEDYRMDNYMGYVSVVHLQRMGR